MVVSHCKRKNKEQKDHTCKAEFKSNRTNNFRICCVNVLGINGRSIIIF